MVAGRITPIYTIVNNLSAMVLGCEIQYHFYFLFFLKKVTKIFGDIKTMYYLCIVNDKETTP